MMRYRVTHVYDLDAASPQEARAAAVAADVPTEIRASLLNTPPRHGLSRYYVQPLGVLDVAWDEYMDRMAAQEVYDSPRNPSLPSVVDLGRADIAPSALSLLFDLAITSFVQQVMPEVVSIPEGWVPR